MMKYEKVHNNFIPKEEKKEKTIDKQYLKTLENDNQQLINEKNTLLAEIENYKQQIDLMEEKILKKDEMIRNTEYSLLELNKEIQKYNELKNDLDRIDTLKNEAESLKNQVKTLNESNIALSEEIESYRQHVQSLYLILLVLALLN